MVYTYGALLSRPVGVSNVIMPTYTYDLTTKIGQVRFNIGDTDFNEGKGIRPGGQNYSDEEISYVLSESGDDVSYATYSLMLRLAGEFAASATAHEFGAFRTEFEDRAKNYQRQAYILLANIKEKELATPGKLFTVAYSKSIENVVIF